MEKETLDLKIINEDINNHRDIIRLKMNLKYNGILVTIGIVDNIETNRDEIVMIILDTNKISDKSSIIPIPYSFLYGKFDDIINFIIRALE